jgi:DNA-binding transcriptional ArsR family regulator
MESMSRPALRLIADRFKLLASPTRLEILQHICDRERTVSEIVELTGFAQANVSKHLSLLDRAGMVRRRAAGGHVHYQVSDGSLPQLCGIIRESIREREGEILDALSEPEPEE